MVLSVGIVVGAASGLTGYAVGAACKTARAKDVLSSKSSDSTGCQELCGAQSQAPAAKATASSSARSAAGRARSPEALLPLAPSARAVEGARSLQDRRGFTEEEARSRAEEVRSEVLAATPGELLAELQRGNARFCTNRTLRPESSFLERRALAGSHCPSVAVLGCSDSRVPVEIVFDQGLGDIFVIRVAGNVLSTSAMASVQYAVHHLKVKVLLVLGHSMCGAVKAARLPLQTVRKEPAELEQLLTNIKVGLSEEKLRDIQDAQAQDREAVVTNVRQQVDRLAGDGGIMSRVESQELIITGAFYEMSSGIVDFLPAESDPCAERPAASDAASVASSMDAVSGRRQPCAERSVQFDLASVASSVDAVPQRRQPCAERSVQFDTASVGSGVDAVPRRRQPCTERSVQFDLASVGSGVDAVPRRRRPCAELSADSDEASVGSSVETVPQRRQPQGVAGRPRHVGAGAVGQVGKLAGTCSRRSPPSPWARAATPATAKAAAQALPPRAVSDGTLFRRLREKKASDLDGIAAPPTAGAAAQAMPARAVSDATLFSLLREKKMSDLAHIPERHSPMPQPARTLLESRSFRRT